MSDRRKNNQSPERRKKGSPESRSRDPTLRNHRWGERVQHAAGLGRDQRHGGNRDYLAADKGKDLSSGGSRDDHRAASGSRSHYTRDSRAHISVSSHRTRNEVSYGRRAAESTPADKRNADKASSPTQKAPKKPKLAKPNFSEDDSESQLDDSPPAVVKGDRERLQEQFETNVALKLKLKSRDREMGRKEAELAAINEELSEAKAKLDIQASELTSLRKRKEKAGTIAIVKNLELKSAKLLDSKQKLKLEVNNLNINVEDLETVLVKKEEEILILTKKEKVSKQSVKHLQKDLLNATKKLKSARVEINNQKNDGKVDLSIDDDQELEEIETKRKENVSKVPTSKGKENIDEDVSDDSMKVPAKDLSIDDNEEATTDVTGIDRLNPSMESADDSDDDKASEAGVKYADTSKEVELLEVDPKKTLKEREVNMACHSGKDLVPTHNSEVKATKEREVNMSVPDRKTSTSTPTSEERKESSTSMIKKKASTAKKDKEEMYSDDDDFIIRKPAKKSVSTSQEGEECLGNLADDDSFFNPPSSSKKVGRNIVKNFEKRCGRHAAPPTRPLRNNSSNNNTVTVLNDSISFLAVRETAKSQHNGGDFGTVPCGLHPYCNAKLYGGEDIGLVYVVSPVFHPSYEKTAWCCWHHAEASLGGMEVQTQSKNRGPVSSTPKNARTKKTGPELTNAPMKKSSKKLKVKLADEGKADSADGNDDEK